MADPRIAIIGSGFGGICTGILLRRAGIGSFTLYEQSDRLGGTWRDNSYPGAACDTPAFSYCFSFAQKADWSRKWAPQPEILGYLEDCARRHGLLPRIRFETAIESARFDPDAGVWQLRTTGDEELEAEILVSAVGQLSRPSIPELPGLARFRGECFHSARWNHAYALEGRRVAVIGNAASAVQFVPQIAPRVERLHVFQRSANWMLPRGDRAFTAAETRRFARHPLWARLYRWWLWAMHELRYPIFRQSRLLARRLERLAERSMRSQSPDPALQQALLPDYPVGGKRILISDDYYAALARENVELVTSPIDQLCEDAIVTADGRRRPVDALIFASGFESTRFLAPMRIAGLAGHTLEAEWKDGARAYLGLAVAGFPNFFMLYGPNTNLGHNSIIFMLECQARYIVGCIRQLIDRELKYIDLRREVMEAFDARLQQELRRSVWAAPDHSWYKTAEGRITNNWSGTTTRYWWRTRRADLGAYHQEPR